MPPRSPSLTVDAVIRRQDGAVLLIRRGHEPFAGAWALPGGFVDFGESCEAAVCREVLEETGLEVAVHRLLAVLSDPDRDPRTHVVSVVYECRIVGGELRAGDDAAAAAWVENWRREPLAFDHGDLLASLE